MTFMIRCIAVLVLTVPLTVTASAQSVDDVNRMQSFLELVGNYYALIEKTHDISDDPEKAAILQMQKIQEVFEDRGEKARSHTVLKRVLDESTNQTIRNAAYLLLSDSLKETGRHDEAVQLLQRALEENVKAAK